MGSSLDHPAEQVITFGFRDAQPNRDRRVAESAADGVQPVLVRFIQAFTASVFRDTHVRESEEYDAFSKLLGSATPLQETLQLHRLNTEIPDAATTVSQELLDRKAEFIPNDHDAVIAL
ncbi:MAG: hypothetical protein GX575_30165 [Candidatus Anammoximicrobium sp.]|nr:hypothetical protein [Candidatus Anammoximicrobium sp.]